MLRVVINLVCRENVRPTHQMRRLRVEQKPTSDRTKWVKYEMAPLLESLHSILRSNTRSLCLGFIWNVDAFCTDVVVGGYEVGLKVINLGFSLSWERISEDVLDQSQTRKLIEVIAIEYFLQLLPLMLRCRSQH